MQKLVCLRYFTKELCNFNSNYIYRIAKISLISTNIHLTMLSIGVVPRGPIHVAFQHRVLSYEPCKLTIRPFLTATLSNLKAWILLYPLCFIHTHCIKGFLYHQFNNIQPKRVQCQMINTLYVMHKIYYVIKY